MITYSMFPGKYIQGYDAIKRLGPEILKIGKTGFLIGSPTVFKNILPSIEQELDNTIKLIPNLFSGECCDAEINKLIKLAQGTDCELIIGMGGGKIMDTAKAVAHELKISVIIVPTVASSDAPCTGLSVVHNEDGSFNRLLVLPHNPEVVLVDTKIIAEAPPRFLVAGMGDALSTAFEADSCLKTSSGNLTGFPGSLATHELAKITFKIITEYGLLAKNACEEHRVTPELEYVVEANTLFGGTCHQNAGAAAAHAIEGALNVLKDSHAAMHGEKVAFGTLASLFLTGKSQQEIDFVYSFCESVGLPTSLADIDLKDISDDDILRVAEITCRDTSCMHNEPVSISTRSAFMAIKAADSEGNRRKSLISKH